MLHSDELLGQGAAIVMYEVRVKDVIERADLLGWTANDLSDEVLAAIRETLAEPNGQRCVEMGGSKFWVDTELRHWYDIIDEVLEEMLPEETRLELW